MNKANNPKVSIVALCYNHSEFLEECLDSIINQNYNNIELIIIDDESQDDSVKKIDKWILKQKDYYDIVFIKHNKNRGLCRSINEGINRSSGKYFQAFACDDIMLPDKISEQVLFLEKQSKNVALVYSDVEVINEDGKQNSSSLLKQTEYYPKMPEGMIFGQLIKKDFIPAPSLLIRKEIFKSVGFYDESLYYEDWDMLLRISLKHEIMYYNKPTVKYRKLSNSMFHSANSKFFESTLISHRKFFKISDKIDEILKIRFINYSLKLYDINAKHNAYWLFQTFKITKNPKVLKYMAFSFLGINVDLRNRVKSLLKK